VGEASGLSAGRFGHLGPMEKLLTDNRVIASAFMLLTVVNAYLIANGYYA
jgi:hypothetical protein